MVEAYAEGNATLFGLNAPNALPALEANSELFSHVAILCSDWPHSNLTLADVQLRNRLVQTIAPLTGGKSVPSFVQIHCLGWPADVRNPPHHVSIPAWGVNLPTIMLVSSFFDPASSPVWAAQVQADIGEDRAVLVTRNHTGHVQYGQTDGRGGATSTAIENYLLKLEVPQNGQVYQS
ncbi:hypothetical protein F5Y16DRAFT_388914 [Xylariaceae sp. FL0255]|nr:hypothetical protein F5Y16DRAFT_388914 [Xylariaceae sp. FL0255]